MIYMLQVIGFAGQEPQDRFAFDAADEQEAVSKARQWARYHGFDLETVCVRATTEEDRPYVRNEYLPSSR